MRRHPERGGHELDQVCAVLDAVMISHVGFVAADGRPVVLPMLHGRIGDRLYLHASVAGRLARTLASGVDCCLTASVVDGLVLARSAFHHTLNYRSVVVLGRAERVRDDEEVLAGLRAISDQLVPGRWDEVRPPSRIELRQTSVLAIGLGEASVKARTGGPRDEPDDAALEVWAGVVPCAVAFGEPIADDGTAPGRPVSVSVTELLGSSPR